MTRLRSIRIRPIFAWYDVWIGARYDRDERRLYILLLPCLGFWIDFPPRTVTLIVSNAGNQKIAAIKAIRTATKLGLKEAKFATEGDGLTLAPDVGYPLALELKKLGLTVEVHRG